MKVLCFFVYIGVVSGIVGADLCPGNSQAFTDNRCLEVITDAPAAFSQASSVCDFGGRLATVSTTNELFTLESYVSALGVDGDSYWLGYLYNGSQLEEVNGDPAPSLITDKLPAGDGISAGMGVCVAVNTDGDLVRMSCTAMLGYVCVFNLTDPEVNMVTVNDNEVMGSETVSIGVNVTIRCQFTGTQADSTVQWTIDGTPITEGVSTAADVSYSSLLLLPFEQCGRYSCQVTNPDGQSASTTIQLFGDVENIIAPPTPVDSIASLADTQDSLLVQWREPDLTYVVNPILVSYTLYYSSELPLNYSGNQFIGNLRVGSDGMGTHLLRNLEPGTPYFLGIRAENGAGISNEPARTQVSTTFGNAPTSAPGNLMLSRNEENSALLADWNDVMTVAPIGRVAFYQVEFRDGRAPGEESDDVTELFINPRFSAASIFNVRNAQAYEVRVATAVQIQRMPREYELSPFTEWVSVSGIVPEVPVIPTVERVEDNNINAALVAGIVVPVSVICIIVVIVVIVLAIVFTYHKKNKYKAKYSDEATDGMTQLCSKCKENPVFPLADMPPSN